MSRRPSINAIRSGHDREYKIGEPLLEPLFVGDWSSRSGMFLLHRCWRCNDGALPCAQRNPRQCEFPRARND